MEAEYNKDEEMERLLEDLKSVKSSDWEFHDSLKPLYSTGAGLNKQVVEEISEIKKEPEWMLRMRLKALEVFESKPIPTWGPDVSGIDWENTSFYNKYDENKSQDWDEVPDEI